MEEFKRQLVAPGFVDSLRVYARRRAELVALYMRVDELYAPDLVQDILGDTFEGVLAWDPKRVDLKKHVRDSIKSRSRHDYVRARRHGRQTVDVDDPVIEAEVAEQEARGEERDELRRRAAALIEALRDLAASDHEVLLLIDAYEQQAETRAEVLELTRLTLRQYEAARERLSRLRKSIPHHLQPTH